jgi:hypothetical protein
MKNLSFLLTNFFIAITFLVQGQTIYVTEDQIWETPRTCDAIEIGNFATLTIKNTTIKMHLKIKVHQSGKLIVDNSIITHDSQYGYYWDGIDIGSPDAIPTIIKASVEIKNGSAIKYAKIGIDMYFDGKLKVSGNSLFQFNLYGIHLRLYQAVPGGNFGNPEISIQDSRFSANDYGIEVHSEAGTIEDIFNCEFSDNNIGIFFRDDYSGNIINTLRECHFVGNNYGIGCKNLNNLRVINCNFKENFSGYAGLDGINAFNSKGIEIIGSNFKNLFRGINATNSQLEVKNVNIFTSISDAAIAALATSPGAASLVVTDSNQFISCPNYGITLSGNTANAKQEISENYFENCWFAVDIDGDNNYQVRDNRFKSCSYAVLSWSSNDFVNEVKCNEMLYTGYGNIYMLYKNSQSSFLGNNFLQSAAGPYKFDFRAYNATIAMKQGDEDHPAMNYFWSIDDIETENSDHFDYYKPSPPVARTDPQNTGNYTEKDATNDDQWNCAIAPVPVVTDVQIRLLKDEYCRILQLYRANPGSLLYKQMFYQISRLFHLNYYFWSIQNEQSMTWEKIDELLSLMCGYKWKIRRYGLNLYHGDIVKAESILNELDDPRLYEPPIVPDDLSDESRTSFITTQRINLRYLRADSTVQFTNAEIDILRTEADRNISERAYARSLYTLATGQLLPRVLPEESIQPRESDEMANETGWSFSPNPASTTLNVNYMGKVEISGKISIYSTDGRLMLDTPARFSARAVSELDVSSLESGIYIISLTDQNNTVIFKDKFIKIK